MIRFTTFLVVIFTVYPAFGAGMAQIVTIVDSNTLRIDERGSRSTIDLAGVFVPPAHEAMAVEFLRRTTSSGWALVERDPHDANRAWLYRSPDGLSINGEMIRAAWLHPGTQMTYLGEAAPGPEREVMASRPAATPRPAKARARPARKVRR